MELSIQLLSLSRSALDLEKSWSTGRRLKKTFGRFFEISDLGFFVDFGGLERFRSFAKSKKRNIEVRFNFLALKSELPKTTLQTIFNF